MRPDVRYARNGEVSLAYQVVGEGPFDLCLAQGYLSNLEWAWMDPANTHFLQRLASFSRLILMDRRGSGLSDRFSPEDAPPHETMMDDLRVVLDAAGSECAAVFGVFDGCSLATLLAASYPERVSALVLYSSSPAGKRQEPDYPWSWDDDGWDEWLDTIQRSWGTREWVTETAAWQAPSVLSDPQALERLISFHRLGSSPSSAAAVLRVQKETDIRNVLPAVRVPTLVLHRTGDKAEEIGAGRYMAAHIPGARFVELSGADCAPWMGDADSVLDEVEEFLTGVKPVIEVDRVLATVMFTDIVGSTERAATIGDSAWSRLLERHHELVRQQLAAFRGREIDTAGDGFLATFDGPARAVRCAQAIARALGPLDIQIRAGVHTGEIELAGDDVRGIAVHIGARVSALAGPTEVLVSSTVKDLVAGSGLSFDDAGEHDLKGVPDRWRLYKVAG